MSRPSWVPTPTPRPPRQSVLRDNAKLRDKILALMRKGATARQAIAELGLHRSRLWNLRKGDASFNARLAILDRMNRELEPTDGRTMRERIESSAPPPRGVAAVVTRKKRQQAERELVNLQQKEAFLRVYRETGSRVAAVDQINAEDPQAQLTAKEVAKELATDKDFAALFEEEQLRHLWDVEDGSVQRAKTSGVDARFLMKQKAELLKPSREDKPKKAAPSWQSDEKMKKTQDWISGSDPSVTTSKK